MEESEKRRERLKAMRMEAAQGDVNNDVKNFTESHGLSNPLIETSATHQESSAPQRFDYYTDPMSAFSGNKRSKVSQNISQEHFTPPSNNIFFLRDIFHLFRGPNLLGVMQLSRFVLVFCSFAPNHNCVSFDFGMLMLIIRLIRNR